jgi:hypothetical protein
VRENKLKQAETSRNMTSRTGPQAVADAANHAERGDRGSGIQIGERRFHLEGRQLGTEATEQTEEQPTEQGEELEEQT